MPQVADFPGPRDKCPLCNYGGPRFRLRTHLEQVHEVSGSSLEVLQAAALPKTAEVGKEPAVRRSTKTGHSKPTPTEVRKEPATERSTKAGHSKQTPTEVKKKPPAAKRQAKADRSKPTPKRPKQWGTDGQVAWQAAKAHISRVEVSPEKGYSANVNSTRKQETPASPRPVMSAASTFTKKRGKPAVPTPARSMKGTLITERQQPDSSRPATSMEGTHGRERELATLSTPPRNQHLAAETATPSRTNIPQPKVVTSTHPRRKEGRPMEELLARTKADWWPEIVSPASSLGDGGDIILLCDDECTSSADSVGHTAVTASAELRSHKTSPSVSLGPTLPRRNE